MIFKDKIRQDDPPSLTEETNTGDDNIEHRIQQISLDPKLEISLNGLQLSSLLGEGNFGKVFKAHINNIDGLVVAAKTAKGSVKFIYN